MRYAQIREMDISNGEGIGISLFVQGCHFHCKNCFNQETWDFNGGMEWTTDIADHFIKLADKPYIRRISILGGEPLAKSNISSIYHLLHKIKMRYGADKSIWVYSGYLWEEIYCKGLENKDIPLLGVQRQVISMSDVFVDGQYVDKLKDHTLKFCGSSNQRVIDVQASLSSGGRVVLWNKFNQIMPEQSGS